MNGSLKETGNGINQRRLNRLYADGVTIIQKF